MQNDLAKNVLLSSSVIFGIKFGLIILFIITQFGAYKKVYCIYRGMISNSPDNKIASDLKLLKKFNNILSKGDKIFKIRLRCKT